MQERHKNRKQYFDEQAYTTEKYVIPYIQKQYEITNASRILEIGCGEGGNLKPFLDRACSCVGIDLNEKQIENAKEFFKDHINVSKLELIFEDIYNVKRDFKFDVIMLRDVIEHIHNQEKFMKFLTRFLSDNGIVFFAFPPWQNPFGGHQQICEGKLSKIPFLHLLPTSCYSSLLSKCGENKETIQELLEIKETGITIERFEKILKENYVIKKRDLFFINPNYEIKFNLKPRKVFSILQNIPYFRNYYTTVVYYLVMKKEL